MSRNRIDLKDKRVVVAVFLLLAVIIIVNVRTFLPDLKRATNRSVAMAEEVPVPDDLEEAQRLAAGRVAALQREGTDPAVLFGGMGGLSGSLVSRPVRDPFKPGSTPVVRKRPGSDKTSSRTSTRSAAASRATPKIDLTCSAVLMMSGKPTALIEGRSYLVGDRVSGYELVRIDREGVLLRSGNKEIFLPVGSTETDGIYYPPVTEAPGTTGWGQ